MLLYRVSSSSLSTWRMPFPYPEFSEDCLSALLLCCHGSCFHHHGCCSCSFKPSAVAPATTCCHSAIFRAPLTSQQVCSSSRTPCRNCDRTFVTLALSSFPASGSRPSKLDPLSISKLSLSTFHQTPPVRTENEQLWH